MKRFFSKLSSGQLSLIGKIAMPLGIALLILSVWGFVKSGHVSMSGKNGSSATLVIVHLRWITMLLGVGSLCGGFVLLKKAEYMGDDVSSENKDEEDPLDFLK